MQTLFHTAGKLLYLLRGDICKIDPFQSARHLGAAFARANSGKVGKEEKIIAGGCSRIEPGIPAERKSQGLARTLGVRKCIHPVDAHSSARGSQQCCAHLHNRCFPRPIGTEQSMNFAGAYTERNIIDSGESVFTFAKGAA